MDGTAPVHEQPLAAAIVGLGTSKVMKFCRANGNRDLGIGFGRPPRFGWPEHLNQIAASSHNSALTQRMRIGNFGQMFIYRANELQVQT